MSKERGQDLLQIASEQVPFGVYAVEKGGKLELRNDKCKSMGELKRIVRHFKQNGYKVYVNRGDG